MTALHLDLDLAPDDAPRLARLTEFRGRAGSGKSRPAPLALVWHDTPGGDLARSGRALVERRIGRDRDWRLERMLPIAGETWIPGTAPSVIEEGDPAAFAAALPAGLMPVAGFAGELRTVPHQAVAVRIASGVLRAVSGERPVCRVKFAGEHDEVLALARGIAGTLRLHTAPATLAAEAQAVAGRPMPPARSGAPDLPADIDVPDAFGFIVGWLLDILLHEAARLRAGDRPEPVHQMRVALRRLRSAEKLFRKAIGGPDLDAAMSEAKALAGVLGPARDWDVFTDSTIGAVRSAIDDPGLVRLAARADRRRKDAYAALAAFLDTPAYRRLGLSLAALAARPRHPAPPPEPAPDAAESGSAPPEHASDETGGLGAFAARALGKRRHRLLAPGGHIADLSSDDLHAIRLDAKRLRYACEFFAPLFPRREVRKFTRRVARLQDRLGHINDGAVAASLLEEIGEAKSRAGGLVVGFVAAGGAEARAEIDRLWRKLRRQTPFWS